MKKILVVEDEITFQQLLKDKLTSLGYEVVQAMDGEAGLDMALSEDPDLILLDIRLPLMDGLDMLHELRKDPKGAKMPVIVLTNFDPDEEMVRKTIEDKPAYYFIKSDIKLSELSEKIKELI